MLSTANTSPFSSLLGESDFEEYRKASPLTVKTYKKEKKTDEEMQIQNMMNQLDEITKNQKRKRDSQASQDSQSESKKKKKHDSSDDSSSAISNDEKRYFSVNTLIENHSLSFFDVCFFICNGVTYFFSELEAESDNDFEDRTNYSKYEDIDSFQMAVEFVSEEEEEEEEKKEKK